jgi:hypothetical protein
LFSFHSLRSGYLCSAIIKAGTSEDAIATVLHLTGYVAGWVPCGKCQMGYVKEVLKKIMVATRLVLYSEGEGDDSVIDAKMIEPEKFHSITFQEPILVKGRKTQLVRKVIEKSFEEWMKERTEEKGWVIKKCWTLANRKIIQVKNWKREVDKIVDPERDEIGSRWFSAFVRNVENRIVLKKLADKLHDDMTNLDDVAAEFCSSVKQSVQSKFPKNKQKHKTKPKQLDNRERAGPNLHRIRRQWEKEEDEVLISSRSKGLPWIAIASKLKGRTNQDCKDRYRNITKKKSTRLQTTQTI